MERASERVSGSWLLRVFLCLCVCMPVCLRACVLVFLCGRERESAMLEFERILLRSGMPLFQVYSVYEIGYWMPAIGGWLPGLLGCRCVAPRLCSALIRCGVEGDSYTIQSMGKGKIGRENKNTSVSPNEALVGGSGQD